MKCYHIQYRLSKKHCAGSEHPTMNSASTRMENQYSNLNDAFLFVGNSHSDVDDASHRNENRHQHVDADFTGKGNGYQKADTRILRKYQQ